MRARSYDKRYLLFAGPFNGKADKAIAIVIIDECFLKAIGEHHNLFVLTKPPPRPFIFASVQRSPSYLGTEPVVCELGGSRGSAHPEPPAA